MTTTVTIIVEYKDGEIRIRHHGPRTLHPGDALCVELRDCNEAWIGDFPDRLLQDETGDWYVGSLQMCLEVLPLSVGSASAAPD